MDPAALGWWHGGVPGLKPGDLLLPRCELPTWRASGPHTVCHPSGRFGGLDASMTVSLTTDPWAALAYADDYRIPWEEMGRALRQPGALYLVQPLVEDDPDLWDDEVVNHPAPYLPLPRLWGDSDYPNHPEHFVRTRRAVVLDVLEERVELPERAFVRHLARYQQWTLNSPVYTETGHLLPSPSMQAAGATAATLADLGTWLPLSAVHAHGYPIRMSAGWQRADEWRRVSTPRRDALMLSSARLGRFGRTRAVEVQASPPASFRQRGWFRAARQR